MGKDTTTLIVLIAAGAAAFWFLRKNGGATMSDRAALLALEQEKTKQKQAELEYLKSQSEQSWDDVLKQGAGSLFEAGGKFLGTLSF